MSRTLLLTLLLAAPIALLAEGSMPSIGYTGAPTDHGGQDCSTCHNSFGAAVLNSPALTADINSYNPGVQQTIHVMIQNTQAQRWGFQITIRSVSDETQSAGDFAPGNSVQVVCDDGSRFGAAPPCNGMKEFSEHMNAPRSSSSSTPFEFDVVWAPPTSEVGDLHVYIAAVAADGDSTAANDHVYTLNRIISATGGCSITRRPTLTTAINAGSYQAPFSSKAMIAIKGLGFQTGSRTRIVGLGDIANNSFPTVLSCVSVQVTGPGVPQPVLLPISYVQTDQINAQMPAFSGTGPVMLTVIINPGKPNELRSDVATLTAQQPFAPAFFVFGTSTSIAAEVAGTSTIIASPSVVQGARAAHPGEIVSLFGTGFGDTNPSVPVGQLDSGIASLTNPITVNIGGTTLSVSDVLYAGLSPQSISGLYQINVRIPASTGAGDIPVTITIGGVQTQSGATIPVQP